MQRVSLSRESMWSKRWLLILPCLSETAREGRIISHATVFPPRTLKKIRHENPIWTNISLIHLDMYWYPKSLWYYIWITFYLRCSLCHSISTHLHHVDIQNKHDSLKHVEFLPRTKFQEKRNSMPWDWKWSTQVSSCGKQMQPCIGRSSRGRTKGFNSSSRTTMCLISMSHMKRFIYFMMVN